MDAGKAGHGDGVFAGDGQFPVAIPDELVAEGTWFKGAINALNRVLDRYFPDAYSTADSVVVQVSDEITRGTGEGWCISGKPQ